MEEFIMKRFNNNIKEGSKALLEAIFYEDKEIIEQIDACLADFDVPENYTPYWVTEEERKELSSDTLVERVNGKLSVYKNSAKEGFDAYVTLDDVKNNPNIREEATDFLDMIEKYDYEIVKFEGEKFIRVMGKVVSPNPRNIIMTNVFRTMLQERYGNSAYVVTTARGVLFVFSAFEDPFNTLRKILFSDLGLLDREFEVLLIENDQLINTFKLRTYNQ